MATVISLTEEKIKELLAGWEGVSLSQEQINALVGQISVGQESVRSEMETFQNEMLPQMQSDLAESSIRVSDLNDILLPQLQNDLSDAQLQLQDLADVTVAGMQEDLAANIENVETRPQIYVQDTPPEDPDENDRGLVVGDTWINTADNNKQQTWNGVEWSTFNVDIADFSLTVRKLLSTKHQIY